MKIILFRIALRFSVALTRFANFVERVVLTAPDDATFDAVHSMLQRRKQ